MVLGLRDRPVQKCRIIGIQFVRDCKILGYLNGQLYFTNVRYTVCICNSVVRLEGLQLDHVHIVPIFILMLVLGFPALLSLNDHSSSLFSACFFAHRPFSTAQKIACSPVLILAGFVFLKFRGSPLVRFRCVVYTSTFLLWYYKVEGGCVI